MCGIAGLINNNLNKDELNTRINSALKSIEYRGPDDFFYSIGNGYALGSVRLSIENLSKGKQPLIDKNTNLIAGFNGEIFNYKKLIKEYNLDTSSSEIELILKLFILKGIDFVNELEGQFAIYIYNYKKNELILFRDRFGIKPLYFYTEKNNIYFGSEIKSIFNLSRKYFSISEKALSQTLTFWTCVGNTCAFNDINKVEPYSCIIFRNGIIKKKKNSNSLKSNIFINNVKQINLYKLVEDAVKRQLQSDVGYACYLSGGIDSSIIAYFLSNFSKKKLDTFSVSFENKEYDESKYQHKISNFLNSNHYEINISEKDIDENFSKTVNHTESILFRTAPVPMYLLSKLVNKKGHKVIFTGEGADEILFGYDIYFERRIRDFWSRIKDSNIRPYLLKKLYNYLPQFSNERYFHLTKDFFKKFLDNTSDIFYSHLIRWDQYNFNKLFFNINKNLYEENLINLKETLPVNFNQFNDDKKTQAIEINTLLTNYLLNSQGDKVTSANSIEARYPYLDDTFVETISRIDPKILANSINSKNLLRKSFKKILPEEIVTRKKFAYQAPEASVFLNSEFESELFLDFQRNLSNLDLINTENFKDLINKIKNPYMTKRLGFRENMTFVAALSIFCLHKNSKKWIIN